MFVILVGLRLGGSVVSGGGSLILMGCCVFVYVCLCCFSVFLFALECGL